MACRKARRLVAAYLRCGVGSGQEKGVRGFPGWKCSTGDRSGSCARGRYKPGTPQVQFAYLEAPGQRMGREVTHPYPMGGSTTPPTSTTIMVDLNQKEKP